MADNETNENEVADATETADSGADTSEVQETGAETTGAESAASSGGAESQPEPWRGALNEALAAVTQEQRDRYEKLERLIQGLQNQRPRYDQRFPVRPPQTEQKNPGISLPDWIKMGGDPNVYEWIQSGHSASQKEIQRLQSRLDAYEQTSKQREHGNQVVQYLDSQMSAALKATKADLSEKQKLNLEKLIGFEAMQSSDIRNVDVPKIVKEYWDEIQEIRNAKKTQQIAAAEANKAKPGVPGGGKPVKPGERPTKIKSLQDAMPSLRKMAEDAVEGGEV